MKNYFKALCLMIVVLSSSCKRDNNEGQEIPAPDRQSSIEEAFPGQNGDVKEANVGNNTIYYQEIDGHNVFEGDIILTNEQIAGLSTQEIENGRTESTGRTAWYSRWPNGIVYYAIDPTLTNQARAFDAMNYWQNKTLIKFVLRTTQANYIYFTPGAGCSSYIGMTNSKQNITLATGCSTGNTIHEVGHALGLWHEQSRSDRDNNVTINWSNIRSGYESNFKTYVEQRFDGFDEGAFDLGSIMMYDPYSFSSNGQPTITKKDGTVYAVQRTNTSNGDLNGVLRMYPYTSDNSVKPVYEFYSSLQTNHFYSRAFAVIQNYAYNSISFYAHTAQVAGSVPVHRFYSSTLGDHYYSISSSTPSGYVYDGIEFYAYNTQATGRIPIYRFYNASIGNNYYSSTSVVPAGYEAKGTAFYAFPKK